MRKIFLPMFKSILVLVFITTIHVVWATEKEKMEIQEVADSDEGPAPDIWTWGLISNRYLPSLRFPTMLEFKSFISKICFVRKRSRLYLTKKEQTIKVL